MERKGFCFPCLDYKNGQGKKEKGKKERQREEFVVSILTVLLSKKK